ncbi:MAG: SufE family protein [Pseudanabaenaceae cyanobacterium SKYGB_i_bin29]|nr:SufE family protein [Pseudanabaenaceae cyanobacterium SKYG29]MDW8420559.1 SufE family protein [Pseudanabaenaceae cyanobacterium SKYGB_i_bin29]
MTTAALPPTLAKLVDRFKSLSDPKARYEQLILYGKKLPPFDPALKIPANRVNGCVSNVYLTAALQDGKVIFSGDSDALISKGFLGFLAAGMNGLDPQTILALSPDFVKELGLSVSLTPSRANGFINVFHTMQKKTMELLS